MAPCGRRGVLLCILFTRILLPSSKIHTNTQTHKHTRTLVWDLSQDLPVRKNSGAVLETIRSEASLIGPHILALPFLMKRIPKVSVRCSPPRMVLMFQGLKESEQVECLASHARKWWRPLLPFCSGGADGSNTVAFLCTRSQDSLCPHHIPMRWAALFPVLQVRSLAPEGDVTCPEPRGI